MSEEVVAVGIDGSSQDEDEFKSNAASAESAMMQAVEIGDDNNTNTDGGSSSSGGADAGNNDAGNNSDGNGGDNQSLADFLGNAEEGGGDDGLPGDPSGDTPNLSMAGDDVPVGIVAGDGSGAVAATSAAAAQAAQQQQDPPVMFEVSVTDPEKKGEHVSQYISYKVNTKMETRSGHVSQSTVVRRYNDFAWLRQRLLSSQPGYLVPPVPGKRMMGRFSVDFVDERRRALEVFLCRVVSHPVLMLSDAVQVFVHGDDGALVSARAEKQTQSDGTAKPSAVMGYFAKLGHSIAAAVVPNKAELEQTPGDIACADATAYTVALETTTQSASDHIETLVGKEREIATSWFDTGLAFTVLSQFENEHQAQPVGDIFQRLGNVADRMSVLQTKKTDTDNIIFHEPMKDYVRITAAMQEALRIRATLHDKYATSLGQLESKKSALADLRSKSGKEVKIQSVELQVKEAQAAVDHNAQELHRVTSLVQQEYKRYLAQKERDMRALSVAYVKNQIQHAQKVQAGWEGILADLESPPSNFGT